MRLYSNIITNVQLLRINQLRSTEFELYLLEHSAIEEQIPDNDRIVLVPVYNQELAEANHGHGQTTVYMMITRLRTSRIEGLTLQVTRKSKNKSNSYSTR